MPEGIPGPGPESDKEAVDGATPEAEPEVAPIELTRAEYDVLLSSPSDSAEIKALAAEKGIEYGEPGSRVKIRVIDPENDPDGNWPKELWMATDKEHFGDKLSNRHGQHPEIEEAA